MNSAVAVLAACFVLNMFGRGLADTYTVFLLPLEREFGWTRSQLTGVYAIYLLVNGLSAPLVGLLFDRFGPRWVYGAGVACLGTAYFLAQHLGSLWHFYLFVGVLVGFAVSLNGMVPGSALLARWYRARLSTAIGIAFSAVGVGTVIFVPLAQLLVTHYDWRFAYRSMGIAMLVLVPIVLFAIPWRTFAAGPADYQARARLPGAGEGWTLRGALRTRIYWSLAQVFFCTATGMFAIVVQLVAFLIDAGYSPLAAATTFGVLGMFSSISIMSSGFLADRFGIRRTVTASFIGTASGMVVLMAISQWPSVLLLVLFVPLFGLCMGTRGPIISSICARHFAGPNVATIYGTVYATNALGAALGSFVGGVLHDLTGGYVVGLCFSLFFIALAVMPFWTVPALKHYR
ncbi:MAG: MFS transporter [Candidatus Parcubacteria bacterium]|nr:MFS transporter [Burkholderiales bacterium]